MSLPNPNPVTFTLTDNEATDVLAYVDRVAPNSDNEGEFTVLYKLQEQYAQQTPPVIYFELTDTEAQDVLRAFERIVANFEGFPTVYYKLKTQLVDVTDHITTEAGNHLVTESGALIVTEN